MDRTLIRAAMRAPYLQRDEEHDLAVRWKESQDQQALHRITTSHMRLVISMAAKFRHFGLSMGDLIQEGHVGLLEAAARFEPERDVRFSTYATWWIRASIQDYILRNWSIVRGGTSSAQKALFFNLRRLRARLAQGSGALSSVAIRREISAALGVSEADVALMDSRLSGSDTSLNAPLIDDGGCDGRALRFPGLGRAAARRDRRRDHRCRTPRRLAQGRAWRAQRARDEDHRGAAAERGRRDAGGARRDARHLQGARAPDRMPRDGKAEIRADQAKLGLLRPRGLRRPNGR